jgi:hypothetical protein
MTSANPRRRRRPTPGPGRGLSLRLLGQGHATTGRPHAARGQLEPRRGGGSPAGHPGPHLRPVGVRLASATNGADHDATPAAPKAAGHPRVAAAAPADMRQLGPSSLFHLERLGPLRPHRLGAVNKYTKEPWLQHWRLADGTSRRFMIRFAKRSQGPIVHVVRRKVGIIRIRGRQRSP